MMVSVHSSPDCCPSSARSVVQAQYDGDGVDVHPSSAWTVGVDEVQECRSGSWFWAVQPHSASAKNLALSCQWAYQMGQRHGDVKEKRSTNGDHHRRLNTCQLRSCRDDIERSLLGGDRPVLQQFPQIRQWLVSYNLVHCARQSILYLL
jgi:hypothetical protein